MTILQNKIDFAVVFSVKNANPNGDPLNGNRPRITFDDLGEVSDVCLKRKIRNRFMDMGLPVFVQSDDKRMDGFDSLQKRAKSIPAIINAEKMKDNGDEYARVACDTWMDVRSFGQVFAFKGDKLSVGVRGPVSLHPAFSIEPVRIAEVQITKSVNSVSGEKKGSDTMGMKSRVDYGLYVFYGSINCQLAEKTGFSEEDAECVKTALCTLFENDASAARPEGSMEINHVYWWKHNCKTGQYSSAKVHCSLVIEPKCDNAKSVDDYNIHIEPLKDLTPEIYE